MCAFVFVNGAMFSYNSAHVVYGETYGQGMSVSKKQRRLCRRTMRCARGRKSAIPITLLWSPYVIGQTIIFLPCDFYFHFFFPRLISAVGIGCLPYFHTWCGLSANLECTSEMCCTRLAENTGHKKVVKNRHLGTIHRFVGLYLRN